MHVIFRRNSLYWVRQSRRVWLLFGWLLRTLAMSIYNGNARYIHEMHNSMTSQRRHVMLNCYGKYSFYK